MRCDFLLQHFSDSLKEVFNMFDVNVIESITEIRFHSGGYITLVIGNTTYFFDYNGDLYNVPSSHCVKISQTEFEKLFLSLCDYSVHKHTDTLINGYISLDNGVRVGVCSKAVYEHDEIISVNGISSLNVRIPRAVKGFSLPTVKKLYKTSNPSIIVAGMPNSGKTTFLRDLAYQLSSGAAANCKKVCVVDERNELSISDDKEFLLNTDILTGFRKAAGIEIALRTMSPEVIICDEIASKRELESVIYGFSCGVSFALSVHVGSRDELLTKPIIRGLISTGEFSYIIYLNSYTYKAEIIDISELENEIYRNSNRPYFNNGNRDIYVI